MNTTPNLTTNKTIHELDQIIERAMADKQALADAKVEKLFVYIEAETEDLHLTTKQLIAAFNKWKRKTRAHKENGSEE